MDSPHLTFSQRRPTFVGITLRRWEDLMSPGVLGSAPCPGCHPGGSEQYLRGPVARGSSCGCGTALGDQIGAACRKMPPGYEICEHGFSESVRRRDQRGFDVLMPLSFSSNEHLASADFCVPANDTERSSHYHRCGSCRHQRAPSLIPLIDRGRVQSKPAFTGHTLSL